jgi:hypothetical protein
LQQRVHIRKYVPVRFTQRLSVLGFYHMSTKAIIGIVVSIIVIGVGFFFFSHESKAPIAETNTAGELGTTTAATDTSTSVAAPQSLHDLVAQNKPLTCTFSTTSPQGTVSGTMYIANGKVAGDFITPGPNSATIQAHMIVRDETSYMWTSLNSTGFKTLVTKVNGQEHSNSVDYNTKGNFSCQAWTPDESKFTLPKGINFQDMTSMGTMPAGMAPGGAAGAGMHGSAAQCGACNQLPAAQKAQCVEALHC